MWQRIWRTRSHLAEAAGIADEKIILDPGVGFGKTYENNLEIINCLEELNMFGYPLLLGCSRKSVIGLTLDPAGDRESRGDACDHHVRCAEGMHVRPCA